MMSMQTKLKYLRVIFFAVLVAIVSCLAATPYLIHKGISITRQFIIEEEAVESLLIIILLVISSLIFKGYTKVLKAHRHMANQAGIEKSNLTSRLSEAFSYIGTVNVEIKEIHSILNSVEHYPRNKKEFKLLMKNLAAKIMGVTGSPWIVIRLIDRPSGRTITEHTETGLKGDLPTSVIGNRPILEGRHVDGIRLVQSCQQNLTLKTVCILPAIPMSEEAVMLATAVTNQIEMFFLLVSLDGGGQNYLTNQPTGQVSHNRYS